VVTVQARFRHPIEPLIAVLTVYLFRSTEGLGRRINGIEADKRSTNSTVH